MAVQGGEIVRLLDVSIGTLFNNAERAALDAAGTVHILPLRSLLSSLKLSDTQEAAGAVRHPHS